MVLDSKHFDDMDDFCEFEDKLESSDGDMGEQSPNHALSWRRLIIEKAVNNVKKAQESKTDLHIAYKKGDLVFDDEAHRFGRVIESRPGFLNLSLLAGGKLVREDINHLDFVRENRKRLTLKEMADKLFVKEFQIIALLNQLELESGSLSKAEPKKIAAKPVIKAKDKKAVVLKAVNTKPAAKLPVKTIKLAAKKKDSKKTKPIAPDGSISFTKLLPKGATTDPVMDPNGYIQQNFLMMSNRELAVATGLSEHTIRRKLGEWNLKRKDFVNKA